jgi:hypothetical protein
MPSVLDPAAHSPALVQQQGCGHLRWSICQVRSTREHYATQDYGPNLAKGDFLAKDSRSEAKTGSFQIPVDSFRKPLAVIGWQAQL